MWGEFAHAFLEIVWKSGSSATKGAGSERQEGKVDLRPAVSGESAKEQRQSRLE